MENMQWRDCLQTCRRVLGSGDWDPFHSNSWCAFTTFSSLERGVKYWACGFPAEEECLETKVMDGGLWRQAFEYQDLAHLIVPASFYWEKVADGEFKSGFKSQNLSLLSSKLAEQNIEHRVTELVLELKLY